MKRPLLSVVIPTWNRARLVGEAIESALAQRPGAVDVIVVDDGSTDNTANLLARRFGAHINLLRQPHRTGVGAARNAGVRQASGELIAFLDSDDLWLPGKLEAELNVLERFADAEAIVSDSQNFLEGRPRESTSRFGKNGLLAATQGRVCWNHECAWPWTNSENGVATCSITLRRGALARLGQPLFAEDLVSCEDWELEVRLYQQCRVVVMPEVWSQVRCFDDHSRPGRATPGKSPNRAQHISLLRDRLKVMERACRQEALSVELAAELERFRAVTLRQLALYEIPAPLS